MDEKRVEMEFIAYMLAKELEKLCEIPGEMERFERFLDEKLGFRKSDFFATAG